LSEKHLLAYFCPETFCVDLPCSLGVHQNF
jgi:hypothetical protein